MRKPIVFGSEYTSYTTQLNYEQCKYRLYLMGDKEANRGKVEIFPPMLRGLMLHKAMELWFAEERQAEFDELYAYAIEPSRDDVDWGLKRVVFYPPFEEEKFIPELQEELQRFYRSLPHLNLPEYEELRTEWEAERVFQNTLYRGHIDIAFKTPSGRWICGDLKTGKYDYESDQFLLYNWIANGFLKYPHPFFIFAWDGNHLHRKTVMHSIHYTEPKLMRLLWQMKETQVFLLDAQTRIEAGTHPAKILRPNTRSFTCHPHRCSFWNECPYGKRKMGGENDETNNGDLG